jgi:ABC-type sugar transport system substrate-binding protein
VIPVSLCLVDPRNEFQQLLRRDAAAAARPAGMTVDVVWSGPDLSGQINVLRKRLASEPRPAALLVMAVRDRGLFPLVRDAARTGTHWIFVNRAEDELGELRREFPSVALSCVCPDELETGRIQGRMLLKLLPHGGKVLHVEGTRRSLAAKDRTDGTAEATQGRNIELIPLEAGWTSDEAEAAVRGWLGIAARANVRLDLVLCHTDTIALGAIAALRAVAAERGLPELAKVRVVGCDGTPDVGRAMVADGRLAATVVLPRSAGPAIELLAGVLAGRPRPAALVTLKGEPLLGPAVVRA